MTELRRINPVSVPITAARSRAKETLLYKAKDFGHAPICKCDPAIGTTPRLYGEVSIISKEGKPKRLSGQLGVRIRTADCEADQKLEREAAAQGLICGFRGGCPADRFYVVAAKIDMLADDPQREAKIAQTVTKVNAFAARVHEQKEKGRVQAEAAPQIELIEAIQNRPLTES